MRRFLSVMLAVAFVGSLIVVDTPTAQARPQYKGAAKTAFPDLAKKEIKGVTDGKGNFSCGLCHPVKDKKKRNDFGVAFSKGLKKKNEKDKEALAAALKKAAATKKTKDGDETFGDLIKGGKAPGDAKPAS